MHSLKHSILGFSCMFLTSISAAVAGFTESKTPVDESTPYGATVFVSEVEECSDEAVFSYCLENCGGAAVAHCSMTSLAPIEPSDLVLSIIRRIGRRCEIQTFDTRATMKCHYSVMCAGRSAQIPPPAPITTMWMNCTDVPSEFLITP